jgi:hypothetical protein
MSREPRLTPDDRLKRLVADLERWGVLFLDAAHRDRLAAEQVIGGLVEWMGNGLVEGLLHLPIPIFEELSTLAEDLFDASRAYLGVLASAPNGSGDRLPNGATIQAILERARALRIPERSGLRGQAS